MLNTVANVSKSLPLALRSTTTSLKTALVLFVQLQHIERITDDVFTIATPVKLAANWVNAVQVNGTVMHVPFGSTCINIDDALTKRVFNNLSFDFSGTDKWVNATALERAEDGAADAIKKIAFTFLNTPYLWGGRCVFGIDCSGFTQMVYKFFGIALLRDARQQATQGVTVDFLQQAVCGDLAFFDNAAGEIIHVGILLNSNEIIHASGKVQVDAIDNGGIISRATGQRTQKLRIIKRYF